MSLTTIEKKTDATLRLVPSTEQQAAVGALLGCAFCLWFIMALMPGLTLTRFSVLYLALIFFAVAMILRWQQRSIEISVPDQRIYFIGRRKQDVYSIPFGMVESLRLTCRTAKGELIDEAMRKKGRGKEPFHLDLILKDAGFETLDRSVLGPDLAATALEIAEKTGFAIEDYAGIGFSRAAKTEYSSEAGSTGSKIPIHSALKKQKRGDESGFEWSMSPGWLYIALMGLASAGLIYGGGYGAMAAANGEANAISGIVLLFVCGFFGYMIAWRLLQAIAGRGFVMWDDDTVRFGAKLFGKEYSSVMLDLNDIKAVRVVAPRVGKGRVELLQESGKVFTTADVASPLAPLSTGDLHWLGNYLRNNVTA